METDHASNFRRQNKRQRSYLERKEIEKNKFGDSGLHYIESLCKSGK